MENISSAHQAPVGAQSRLGAPVDAQATPIQAPVSEPRHGPSPTMIDSWAQPTVSHPLSYWPKQGVGMQAALNHPVPQTSLLSARIKPLVPKKEAPVAHSPKEVVKPTLRVSPECPKGLELKIQKLFNEVTEVSIGYGLGDKKLRTFHVEYIDRKAWSTFLFDRDRETAQSSPAEGIRALGLKFTRWIARLYHTWTTPVYFDKKSGDIMVVGNNFGSRFTPEKQKLLAELLVRRLQRVAYKKVFDIQDNLSKDPDQHGKMRPDGTYEAMAATNVQLCLMALEADRGVVLHGTRWVPDWLAFWRKGPSKQNKAFLQRLRGEKNIDGWFRRMFATPFWAAFLFQKGGDVPVGKTPSQEDDNFIARCRELNPQGPRRLKN